MPPLEDGCVDLIHPFDAGAWHCGLAQLDGQLQVQHMVGTPERAVCEVARTYNEVRPSMCVY